MTKWRYWWAHNNEGNNFIVSERSPKLALAVARENFGDTAKLDEEISEQEAFNTDEDIY